MFGAVLDGTEPHVRGVDGIPVGYPPIAGKDSRRKGVSFIETGLTLLLDDLCAGGDSIFEQLHDVIFGFIRITRRIVLILAEVGTDL